MKEQIQITYYTDPLCCWSWAMEPAWQQLLENSDYNISWRYCMGGLLQDWNTYRDVQQSVSRPIQMGPLWLEAKYISGQPIDEKIWITDPPASSYPACLAVKCAALQSVEAEHLYLPALRKAVMIEGRNIAKKEVLLAVAASLSGVIDLPRFEKDLEQGNSLEALRADLQEVSYRDIRRFPTLVIRNREGGVVLTGYRPYEAILQAIEKVVAGAPV